MAGGYLQVLAVLISGKGPPVPHEKEGVSGPEPVWTFWIIRGVDDKSLARPTSRCRRKESIVSLERGVCSCADAEVIAAAETWLDGQNSDFL